VAGMVKNLPAKVWTLLEQQIGKTTTSLARKKARLIFAMPDAGRTVPINPYPVCYPLENSPYQLLNHANVFSRDSLDIGTRFLLAHLPKPNPHDEIKQIVDLGCGNGVVGLLLAEHYPEATLHFVDESFMAIASAQTNFQQSLNPAQGKFYVSDGLTEFANDSMDLIVCNPPFHQQQTLGDQIAWGLFKHAKRVLKKGGQFWVIGNRHLAYQHSLKKLFTQPVQIATNAKFEIIKVCK
jgi:23S rRNA (guanine1835-N2)-methyltransferase